MKRIEIGAGLKYIELTPTLTTDAHTANDLMFDSTELANIFPYDTAGIWHSLTVLDKDDQGTELDVYILKTEVDMGTANAEVAVSDANADEILWGINVGSSDYDDLIGSQIAFKDNIGGVVTTDTDSSSLWVAAVTRGTPTHSASGMTLKFGFLQQD